MVKMNNVGHKNFPNVTLMFHTIMKHCANYTVQNKSKAEKAYGSNFILKQDYSGT